MSDTAIDPELRKIARVLPRGISSRRTLQLVRLLTGLAARRRPPTDVEVVRVGSVDVRVHRPPSQSDRPAPALLWIHGGGYVLGLAAQDDDLCRLYARRTGAIVAAVDYRLAPEHPQPTPMLDCYDALTWLAGRDDVDAARVAIGGASAGGGLAATLAQHTRELGEVHPVLQLLTYPMLDDRTVLRSDIDESDFRMWNNRSNHFGWRAYLGTEPGSDLVASPAAPARATELSGLPPAWIGVGGLDLFHDEDVDYARRLRAAGVSCDLDVVPGAFHAFDSLVPKSQVSRQFRDAQVAALRAAFCRA